MYNGEKNNVLLTYIELNNYKTHVPLLLLPHVILNQQFNSFYFLLQGSIFEIYICSSAVGNKANAEG